LQAIARSFLTEGFALLLFSLSVLLFRVGLIAAEKQATRFRVLLPGKHIARLRVSHGMQAAGRAISVRMPDCFHRELIGKRLFIRAGASFAAFRWGGMTGANRGCGAAIA
jgi:isocitrate dehydrogenase kinase/phosphatase